jgi:hypothetical protein
VALLAFPARVDAVARHRLIAFARRVASALMLCAAALGTVVTPGACAVASAPTEYEVKAALLYNFAKFVSWPDSAFEDARAPFIIGVLGDDPFGDILERTVNDRRVGERPFVIRRWTRVEDARPCHILFVSASEQKRVPRLIQGIAGANIFTVGDVEGFAERGGIADFEMDGKRVRIEINPKSADRAKLHISSKLLALARIVKDAH